MSKTEIEGVERARKARKVAEAVLAGLKSGQIESAFTARELGKRHLAAIPDDALPDALALLVDDGTLEARTAKTGGRKRTEYRLASRTSATSASPSAAILQAQLANAERDRLDALEEAECATDDRDGYRRELARVRGQVRELERQVRELETRLRTERHEHAETMARLARQTAPFARTRDFEDGTGVDEGDGTKARQDANSSHEVKP